MAPCALLGLLPLVLILSPTPVNRSCLQVPLPTSFVLGKMNYFCHISQNEAACSLLIPPDHTQGL